MAAKPIKPSQLREILTDVLERRAPAAAPPPATLHLRPLPAGVEAPRILLVEDNLVNQKVAAIILRKLGLACDIAADGREAVAKVAQDSYDLVFMDIHMPNMDGLDATRAIRRDMPPGRQPYIVALTAAAMNQEREAAMAAGVDDYLTKPFTIRDLQRVIDGLARQGWGVAGAADGNAAPSGPEPPAI